MTADSKCEGRQYSVLLAGGKWNGKSKIENTIKSINCSVSIVSNLDEMIARTSQCQFDVVVVDVEGVDTYAPTFIAKLKKYLRPDPATKVIATGNCYFPNFETQILQAGAEEFTSRFAVPKAISSLTI